MRDVAEAIRSEVERARRAFLGWTDAEASKARQPGKWNRKQILGHLIDSAANNHQRFVRAQFSERFKWPGYDQVAWVDLHGYDERAWGELLTLWVALNGQIAAVVESVPAERLATPCLIGEDEPRSLEWWMRDYLRHLKHHLAQIEQE